MVDVDGKLIDSKPLVNDKKAWALFFGLLTLGGAFKVHAPRRYTAGSQQLRGAPAQKPM